MMDEFERYRNKSCATNETFKFWDRFIVLVRFLRNLVRADRECNWDLHLDTENPVPFLSIGLMFNLPRGHAHCIENCSRTQNSTSHSYKARL